VIATALVVLSSASAATLVLSDGSVISGDVRSLQNDVYTVETESLGTITVRKQDVRSIDLSDESEVKPPALSSGSELTVEPADLQAMQLRMMQNPNVFSLIQALQSDPQVQSILSDPAIMSAVASGDIATLMNHPKIIALTSNPKFREVIEELR
jgi:hypothetical protein